MIFIITQTTIITPTKKRVVANEKQLKTINERYNDVQDNLYIGIDYCCEGLEITNFEVDENGRVTVEFTEWYLNYQYALRSRRFERHPRLKPNEIAYLLGNVNRLK